MTGGGSGAQPLALREFWHISQTEKFRNKSISRHSLQTICKNVLRISSILYDKGREVERGGEGDGQRKDLGQGLVVYLV